MNLLGLMHCLRFRKFFFFLIREIVAKVSPQKRFTTYIHTCTQSYYIKSGSFCKNKQPPILPISFEDNVGY